MDEADVAEEEILGDTPPPPGRFLFFEMGMTSTSDANVEGGVPVREKICVGHGGNRNPGGKLEFELELSSISRRFRREEEDSCSLCWVERPENLAR